MKLEIVEIRARLSAPFVSGSGSVSLRELLLVRLEAADGHFGFGEAAPLHGYDGVELGHVRAALEDCREALAEDCGREELLARCTRCAVLPQAVAAIDLALWDLEGRRAGQPVWRLLGAADPAPVPVNATIASADRAGAAAAALSARKAGFSAVKVKVGIGDDAGRLAAVRAAGGPELVIRLDANGAWSVEEALASLRVLEPAGIELCEEPASGAEAIAAVSSRTQVPIAIDETAREPGALERRLCEAACLKISGFGGISGVLSAALLARDAGYSVYLASTLDGPLGIAGALHVAAAIGVQRPCGLATLGLFEGRQNLLAPTRGRIAVPAGPGLGPELPAWYRGALGWPGRTMGLPS